MKAQDSQQTFRYSCECGKYYPAAYTPPIHCGCGRKVGTTESREKSVVEPFKKLPAENTKPLRKSPPKTIAPEATRKASICRSNACGHYDAQSDTCGILRAKGRAGAIQWLYSHPDAKCVADDPLF